MSAKYPLCKCILSQNYPTSKLKRFVAKGVCGLEKIHITPKGHIIAMAGHACDYICNFCPQCGRKAGDIEDLIEGESKC